MGLSLSSRRRSTKVVRGAAVFVAAMAIVLLASAASLALVIPVTARDGTQVGSIDVGVSPDGTGIVGGFTSSYGDPNSLDAAAKKCGEHHFNWYQVVTSDNDPPTLPDGSKPVPPYIDPPTGGYSGQWADGLPWYWDEGEPPPPGTPGFEPGYHLHDNLTDKNGDGINDTLDFVDYPYGPPPTHVTFETWLVSCNADGSLHSFHGGFSWEYHNPPGAEAAGLGDENRNIFPPPTLLGGLAMITHPLTPFMAYPWYTQLVGPFTPPGDANRDGCVNDKDAAIMAAHWAASGPGIGWDQGDFNSDGIVNDIDASIMGSNWMFSIVPPPPAEGTSSVPEPNSIVLLMGIVVSLALLRWRRCR
jgi:hypothetical protein